MTAAIIIILQESNSLSLNLSTSVFTLLTPIFLRFVVICFCYVRTCYVFLAVCDVVLLFVAFVCIHTTLKPLRECPSQPGACGLPHYCTPIV